MTIEVRLATENDNPRILELMDQGRGSELTEAERAAEGFVQGALTDDVLRKAEESTGVYVAQVGDEIIGFAMTSDEFASPAPVVAAAVEAVRADLGEAEALFVYGPTVVDPRYRGQGALTQLLAGISRNLRGEYRHGVAMVDTANAKSLAVHEHLGMRRTAPYSLNGREYVGFSFETATLATRAHKTVSR